MREIINILKETKLLDLNKINFVILYGSHSKNTYGPMPDIYKITSEILKIIDEYSNA